MLVDVADMVDVVHVELWVQPCVNMFKASVTTSTLPVRSPLPNKRALDAIRPRHQPELGRRDPGAAVVMRMQANDQVLAIVEIAAHPFDLVGIDVRRRSSPPSRAD